MKHRAAAWLPGVYVFIKRFITIAQAENFGQFECNFSEFVI